MKSKIYIITAFIVVLLLTVIVNTNHQTMPSYTQVSYQQIQEKCVWVVPPYTTSKDPVWPGIKMCAKNNQ